MDSFFLLFYKIVRTIGLWSPVNYTYSQIGSQKVMEQSRKKYGSRISILGLWQAGKGFEYGLAQGGFKGKS